jgi:hypothetical protein
MFEDVSNFNTAIGNPKGDSTNIEWSRIERQLQLIEEEFEELKQAIRDRDEVELRDAMCDTLVTTLGMYHISGFDADDDMAEVSDSNFSKLCMDVQESEATQVWYDNLGVETHLFGDYPDMAVKVTNSVKGTDGKFYPAGKGLKNINWKEPNFD